MPPRERYTGDYYPMVNEPRTANNRRGKRQRRREQPRKDKQLAAMVKKMGY